MLMVFRPPATRSLCALVLLLLCCRWLSVRLEGMGALCTLLAALVTVEQQSGRAATMGLLLTYALQVRDLRFALATRVCSACLLCSHRACAMHLCRSRMRHALCCAQVTVSVTPVF